VTAVQASGLKLLAVRNFVYDGNGLGVRESIRRFMSLTSKEVGHPFLSQTGSPGANDHR
jgi:hypothetical protein